MIEFKILEQSIADKKEIVARLTEMENVVVNVDRVPLREDTKYIRYKNLFEELIKKMIADGKIDATNLDFKDAVGKPKMTLIAMERLAHIGSELADIINPDGISKYLKCFLILKLIEADHETIGEYIKPFAQKIQECESEDIKCECCGSLLERERSIKARLKVLTNYDHRFSELFEYLEIDIRGSISHERYEILDNGDKVVFGMCDKEKRDYTLFELAKVNMYLSSLLNIILAISAKIQLEELEKIRVQTIAGMR
jgi:hypothetical protein